MGKRISAVFLAGTLVLSLFLSGCGKTGSSNQAGTKGLAVPVAVQPVKRADITKELVVSGQLCGEQTVVVSPKISGKVAAVNVDLGSRVAAGDALFTLDDTDLQLQVQQSEAAVAVSEAKRKVAEVNRENAAREFERYRQLYEQGAVSAEKYEEYRLKLDQAMSGEPEANLAQMQANLAYQRSQLANTVITSPISGEVSVKNIEVGSMVSPSTQALTVVNLDRVKVQVSVGEQHISKIKPGQEVKVVIPSVRQEPFSGTVLNISPAADPKTKGFLVEVRMDNPGHVLKQGMFAEVHIALDRSQNALAVPVDAVVQKAGEYVVYTVVDGAAKENKVKVGISDGKLTEIVEGLSEGDQVVTTGQESLVNGAKVMVQEGQPGGAGRPDQGGQPKGEK